MPAPAIANPAVASFVRRTTMQSILGLEQEALDHVMATAYLLYQAGRYAEVDVLCRGLIAADHTYWWSYSLHAGALRRMGRLAEALEQIDRGLEFETNEKKLLLMRGEILAALGAWKDRPSRDEAAAAAASPESMSAVSATPASRARASVSSTTVAGG
jgi:tetratricopeptide (TPR) repeat protein